MRSKVFVANSDLENEPALNSVYDPQNRYTVPISSKMDGHPQMQSEQPKENPPIPLPHYSGVMTAGPSNSSEGIQEAYMDEVHEATTCMNCIPGQELYLIKKDQEVSQLRSEISWLWWSYRNAESEYERITELNTGVQQEVEILESECKKLIASNASAEQECLDLKAEVTRLQRDIQNLQSKIDTLVTDSSDSKKVIRTLEAKIHTLHGDLEACKDDLFRLQPAAQIPDTEIVSDFNSLAEKIHRWIEVELSDFERTNPAIRNQDFFSSDSNADASKIIRKYPEVGEYLVRYEIHRYLQEHMLGDMVYLLGLPENVTSILQRAQDSMARLQPRKGMKSI